MFATEADASSFLTACGYSWAGKWSRVEPERYKSSKKLWKCKGVRLHLLDECRGEVPRRDIMQYGDQALANPE